MHGQIPSGYIGNDSLNLKEGLVVEVDILAFLEGLLEEEKFGCHLLLEKSCAIIVESWKAQERKS